MVLRRAAPFVLALSLTPACGGDEPKKAAPEVKAEEAKPAEDDAVARRRAEREAKAKAEKEAEEARLAAIDALAVLPPKLPKDLKKACDAVADAQLKFFERMFEGPELDKLKAAQGTQRPMTIQGCTSLGSLEAAACQITALDGATDKALKSSISDIMRVCIEKFAKQG